jgi:hypothetical protein
MAAGVESRMKRDIPMPTENRSSNTEMVSVPEGFMLVERSIWTEQQVEAATACITRLRGVHGMRDRDLAMAAIDAAQCKAPDIDLADLLPVQQPHPDPIAWMVDTAIWWTKEEAERDADAMGLPVISVGPIGDIELAREMLRRADRREGKWARLCAGRNNQIAELRAQLAEAQEVLRDCIEVGELNAETEWKALRVSKGRQLYVDDRALSALEVQP